MNPKLHPLVRRLAETPGHTAITLATLDGWLAGGGARVLFFSGDPVRFPEAVDVAVVLPELRAALARRFEIGVVLREDEDAVARRFGAQHWPSLVFLRDGRYVATIAGMKDWDEYLRLAAAALEAPATRAPTVGIPVVGNTASAAACR
jgi:hydrogenase-1 operon protein HyaE